MAEKTPHIDPNSVEHTQRPDQPLKQIADTQDEAKEQAEENLEDRSKP